MKIIGRKNLQGIQRNGFGGNGIRRNGIQPNGKTPVKTV